MKYVALHNINNNGEMLNDVQIKDVFNKYDLWHKL